MSFCQDQGLVTFETEEKFLDLKYIVGPDEENSNKSHTALYNPTGFRCKSASTCDSVLVGFMNSIFAIGTIYCEYFSLLFSSEVETE